MTVAASPVTTCQLAIDIQDEIDLGVSLAVEEQDIGHASRRFASTDLEHAILHFLATDSGPLGSGALMERLWKLGYRGSEPTVGRFLRKLDRDEITKRISNRGRDLTERGHLRLRQLCEAEAQRYYESELIRTIRTATIDDILDVLIARRALEREISYLAAEYATPEEIAEIEGAILEQHQILATKGISAYTDMKFHSLLAQAARNRVLTAASNLIRRDKHLTLILDAILKETGYEWVVGHEEILDAVKQRAPELAERAMLHHINSVIAAVQRYRDRLTGERLPVALESFDDLTDSPLQDRQPWQEGEGA